MTARFSIGIDLGTTGSALAYVPLAGDAHANVLNVAQWETSDALIEAMTLPSFLYFPEDALAEQLHGRVPETPGWIVGRLARRRAGEIPGRVVRSAKSWLCHHAADRSAPILPWGSEDLPPTNKISPVQAAAFILNYFRGAWDSRFAPHGDAFDDQEVTVTVPASFDAAAQRLTLSAAEEAGFPSTVHLLEEPQAAFYCWLEQHSLSGSLWEGFNDARPRHVLVVDIGGGTSDFSLFELRPATTGGIPNITRVAVSEHILLGGDNIDLALAVLLEPRLAGERGRISGPQWDHLVASCRDIKEQALSGFASPDQQFMVALPGRGSSLVGTAQTAALARDEVERLVLDGFFPACDASARPYRTQAGLRDWGLPYAADSAVTHHLADFLRDRPRVDAVLFNGGSLQASLLRNRLLEQLAVWQGGTARSNWKMLFPILRSHLVPRVSASCCAAILAALPQALHELHFWRCRRRPRRATTRLLWSACCPAMRQPNRCSKSTCLGFEVRTDQLVSFQACSSTRHGRCKAGDVLPWGAEAYHTLPPLQTIIRTAHGPDSGSDRTVPCNVWQRK